MQLTNEPELGGESDTDFAASPGTSAKSDSLEAPQEISQTEEPVSMLTILD